MTRRFHVEGTKVFLIWAVVLLVFGLWCVKDGWYPSGDVLAKHPMEQEANFYLFNKSLAILSLIGFVICGYIHFVVK